MSSEDQTTSASESPAPKQRQRRYKSPRFTVSVTKERIAESVRRSSSHCMIAEAIKDAHPEFTGITVDLATIRVSEPKKQLRYTYLTPRPAQEALILFDQGVIPPEFELKLQRASQITRSARWQPKRSQDSESKRSLAAEAKEEKLPPLGSKRVQSEGGNSIPTIIGGHPPPLGLLVGRAIGGDHDSGAYNAPGNVARRRMFGLKMLRI